MYRILRLVAARALHAGVGVLVQSLLGLSTFQIEQYNCFLINKMLILHYMCVISFC